MRFTDEDQVFKSVAIIASYETAASLAQTNPKIPKVFFLICSVALANYNPTNDEVGTSLEVSYSYSLASLSFSATLR